MCEVKHTINFGQIRTEYIKTHYHVLEGESTSNLKISKLEMFKEKFMNHKLRNSILRCCRDPGEYYCYSLAPHLLCLPCEAGVVRVT